MERRNRLVRIFVSSTFQDMELERDALQIYVVPPMQQWCQERGWQFEIVDLRWGISEEASQAHRTMSICLEELANCRQLSPKPHLLLLLGERYGWLPLPESFSQEEMQRLLSVSIEEERVLLEKTYRLESNNYPVAYEIQSSCSIDEELMLRNLMIKYCNQAKDNDFHTKHLLSATEQEIQQGLLSHTELFDQVVTYERTLTSLPKHLECQYLDPNHRNELQLLYQKVNEVVPDRNIIKKAIDYTDYNSEKYAKWFADEITIRLQALVNEEISTHNIEEYEEERLNQQYLVESTAGNYQLREDEVERILHTLNDKNSTGLCVVRGASGAGLTTLAAHICRKLSAQKDRPIYRFVGIGQMSSSGLLLLRTLLREFGEEYNDNDSVFDLMAKWRIYLEERTQKTILIIDGLDRLGEDDWVRLMQWLPSPIPANIRVLLTLNDDKLLLELKRFLAVNIHLPNLGEKQFIDALIGDLHLRNRQLTSEQIEVVKRIYHNLKNPIARHPLLALAAQWSDKDIPQLDIPGLQELMDSYLDELIVSNYHDERFLGLALSLLCFCRHGVSEQEILEITATDQFFFSRLQKYAHHHIIYNGRPKVPFIYWSRLHHDIGIFLVVKRNKSSITYVFANKTIEHCVEQWIDRHYSGMRHEVVKLASNYFEQIGGSRFYEEMPYLLEKLGDNIRQNRLITSNDLMFGKCGADMVDDLITDYDHYLKKRPQETAAVDVLQKQMFLQKNHKLITTYAKYGTDVIQSLWEQDMQDTQQAQTAHHCTGKAYTTTHIPGSIIAATANDECMVVCHTPPSGTSDTYMECFLINRKTRSNIAFALLPLGWNHSAPSHAILSNDNKLVLLFSSNAENYILWHTDSGVVESQKKDELWDMTILPDNTICYLTRSEMRTIDDKVLFSFNSALGTDSNQKRKICLDPSRNTVYIVVSDRRSHMAYQIDTGEIETFVKKNVNFAYIIGYDASTAYLFYREDEDKSIYCYSLRDNKTTKIPIQPENWIPSTTLVSGRWLAYINNNQVVCFDFSTNQTIVSDEGCNGNMIQAFGTSNTFLTTSCYELKEWKIAE